MKSFLSFILLLPLSFSAYGGNIYSEAEYATYCACRQLAELTFDSADKVNSDKTHRLRFHFFKDGVNNSVSAGMFKTNQGLVLVFGSTLPIEIITPWGKWGFMESYATTGSGKSLLSAFLKKFLISIKMDPYSKDPSFDKFFSISKVRGTNLPRGKILPTDYYGSKKYKKSAKKWKAMTERYELEQNGN